MQRVLSKSELDVWQPGNVQEQGEASNLDPAPEADLFLHEKKRDGLPLLRFRDSEFLAWNYGAYEPYSTPEIRGKLVCWLNGRWRNLNTGIVGNVLDQLKAQSLLPARFEPPAWLEKRPDDWPADELLVVRNGLLHLPSAAAKLDCLRPLTPRFFTRTALPYEFLRGAPQPDAWLTFLETLWRDDPQSIATLRQWFGYCLTGDTSLQKILLLIGPKRSGKGTVARILRYLIGEANVAGPTLGSLGTNFGLWPLVAKLVAIISDARLSGRTDTAIVVERLLAISGEDAVTIDRKNLHPITVKLPTRFMVLTNELPRLGDASGAMASRFIILRLTESFYGREDHALTSKLTAELPGILNWAIEGWAQLRAQGRLSQPESATELVEDLEELASPISAFIRECCVVAPGYRVSVGEVFTAWCRWSESKGRKGGTEQTFGRDLSAALPHLRKVQPKDPTGQRFRAYDGLGLVGHYGGDSW